MKQLDDKQFDEMFLSVIREQTLISNFEYKDDDKIYDYLDSLDIIEIVMHLEDELEIEISDEEIDSFSSPEKGSFKDFKNFIKQKINK